MIINMLAEVSTGTGTVCKGLGPVFGLIGYVLLMVKIAVPIILIVIGMIEMAKAIFSKKDDDIKEAQGKLVKKAIVAILVFLIITIVTLIFSGIMKQTDYKKCSTCIDKPNVTTGVCAIKNKLSD